MASEVIRWVKVQDGFLRDGQSVETSFPLDSDPLKIRENSENIINKLQCQASIDLELLDAWQDSLQEAILLELYELFQKEDIDLDERLVIILSGDGRLEARDHCQQGRINELLAKKPELGTKMQTMAALALIQRGVTDLEQARLLFEAESRPQQEIFQACLRGSLSHFHLLSKN